MSLQAVPALPPAPAWDLENDALAHALAWLTRHHGRERTAHSLLAGQPIEGRIGPDQALRALREAGYTAGLVQRPLAELHPLLLPAVLLLNEGDACIVTARDPADPGRYEIVMPGPEHHACSASQAELEAEYSGVALVATPQPAPETARRTESAEEAAALHDPSRHWLWGTLRRFVPYYRSALLAAFLSNLLMLVTGLATAVIYDKVIPHQAFVTLWAIATACALAIAFDLVARQLRAYLIDMAGRKVDLIVGSTLFRQTLGLRMEYRPDSAGAYAHHLAQVELVREFFASATLAALSDLPFIVLFIAMAFVIGGPLGWVPALAVPTLLVIAWLIQGALRRAMTRHMRQTADLHGVLVEAVDGLEDLKAAGAQGRFLRRYEEATVAAAEAALRSRKISSWTMNLSSVSQQIVTVVMLVWGVWLIDAKLVTAGALIGAVMFATRAVAPLMSVVQLATRYQGARAAMRALDRVMNQPVDREEGKAYVPRPELTGRIGLRDVGFAYPTPGFADREPGPRVLKGVTLAFQPGERVAVLGRIGSGKSTVLRLMAGLYQPTEGMVEVDGMDLRQIDPADYRARVGFVAQDPRLFNGTLRDNILLDRPTADPSRLADVARLTGLDRLVASHPQGWELPVGEAGALLSGGQRQLVALARCLVTRPQIVLMDEPTSSMDAQSEVAFLRQLKEAIGGAACTLVMVTHRPAVLELVGRIVVIDAGRVVMDGPKAQVLAALSGAKPAAAPNAAVAAPSNLHMHPSAQPVQREASV
ncbi:MAG: type I secretion system permease/ATPase [Rubrivivax sp.]|nr:type I secretion system permease/ATPase [Rubrivivax sp.]